MASPRLFLVVVLLVTPGLVASAERRGRLDYSDILRQVADLERLPHLEEGVVSRQFSSYHRGSRYDRESGQCVGMDINGDAGHYLTVHSGPDALAALEEFKIPSEEPRFTFGDLQWVLDPLERNHVFFIPGPGVESPRDTPPKGIVATIPGPGCVYRIWSANPTGTLRLYLDGSTEPLELDFKAIFLGGVEEPSDAALEKRADWPFLRPFTFRRPGEQNELASDCYLPIPFQKSCVVTLDPASFYHFGYKTFPAGTQVETFHLPLDAAEVETFDEVSRKLLAAGADPKPRRPGTEETNGSSVLEPGQVRILADLKGPRVIQALHAKLTGNERYAHSKVLLEAFFDDEPEACIWSPLVNFFGTGFEPRDYRSLPLGYVDGEGYSYFPMPFRKRARIRVTNEGAKPVALSYRVVHAPAPELPPNTMHFRCKYRREPVSTTFDYPLLECTGQGRFCGVALSIDDALRSWWGEGDEKIWVDDDVFPSFFGTGSEDYFGDAWGIRTLHQPFFACSLYEVNADHSWTSCYRYQIPDDVPFHEKIRVTIENYPESIWGNQAVSWDEDYASTAYWYQMPGGSDFFSSVPVEQRRPWGKVPAPPFVEAEEALSGELQSGARLVNDEGLDRELSRGLAIDLGEKKAGDTLTFLGPELILEGPYTVLVHTPQGMKGPASFELFLGDQRVGETPPNLGGPDAVLIGAAVFSKGRSELTLRFTSQGLAVLDGFQLQPARQIANAREAEGAKVVRVQGGTLSTEIGIPWSAGKQLAFDAEGPGATLELEVDVPRGSWNFVAGLTRGRNHGNYRAEVQGRDVGTLSGYSRRTSVLDGARLGTLRGRNGPTRILLTCVGKDPSSSGYRLGLDYLGWSRIVVEDAIEGETAEIVDVRDGRFVEQKLGDRFSGEEHLWFHPTKIGASFVWPLKVAEAGRYRLAAYFTKSWDYAVVKVSLDGKALAEVDTYAPTVEWGGKTDLGVVRLEPGAGALKFEIVGRNEKSAGILMGVDCITLEKE